MGTRRRKVIRSATLASLIRRRARLCAPAPGFFSFPGERTSLCQSLWHFQFRGRAIFKCNVDMIRTAHSLLLHPRAFSVPTTLTAEKDVQPIEYWPTHFLHLTDDIMQFKWDGWDSCFYYLQDLNSTFSNVTEFSAVAGLGSYFKQQ